MKPIKVKPGFRSNMWKPGHKVWYQHNDDKKLTRATLEIADRMSKNEGKEFLTEKGRKELKELRKESPWED